MSESLTDTTYNSDTEAETESVTEVEDAPDQQSPINSENVNESGVGEHTCINTNMAEGTTEFHKQNLSQMCQSIFNAKGGAPPFMNVDQGAM